jgi:hypothetical protein
MLDMNNVCLDATLTPLNFGIKPPSVAGWYTNSIFQGFWPGAGKLADVCIQAWNNDGTPVFFGEPIGANAYTEANWDWSNRQ